MTLLMDVKAIINTYSLAYVHEEFKSEFVLTSAHFGMGNQRMIFPFVQMIVRIVITIATKMDL